MDRHFWRELQVFASFRASPPTCQIQPPSLGETACLTPVLTARQDERSQTCCQSINAQSGTLVASTDDRLCAYFVYLHQRSFIFFSRSSLVNCSRAKYLQCCKGPALYPVNIRNIGTPATGMKVIGRKMMNSKIWRNENGL